MNTIELNISEQYDEILNHLEAQKDKEKYICELIKADMTNEKLLKKQKQYLSYTINHEIDRLIYLIREERDILVHILKKQFKEVSDEINDENKKLLSKMEDLNEKSFEYIDNQHFDLFNHLCNVMKEENY